MARLEEVVLESEQPTWLAAHSLGCHLVSAWAAHSRLSARVRGALLVAIPDVEREDMPPQLHGWRPALRQPLPLPSVAVLSLDDPYCEPDRGAALAAAWGARVVWAGHCGHLNGASGLGDWGAGQALLQTLIDAS
jgi:predicted alpha/beta hydrolase family esterase